MRSPPRGGRVPGRTRGRGREGAAPGPARGRRCRFRRRPRASGRRGRGWMRPPACRPGGRGRSRAGACARGDGPRPRVDAPGETQVRRVFTAAGPCAAPSRSRAAPPRTAEGHRAGARAGEAGPPAARSRRSAWPSPARGRERARPGREGRTPAPVAVPPAGGGRLGEKLRSSARRGRGAAELRGEYLVVGAGGVRVALRPDTLDDDLRRVRVAGEQGHHLGHEVAERHRAIVVGVLAAGVGDPGRGGMCYR